MKYNNSLSALYNPRLKRRSTCILTACDDKYCFCLYAALQSFLKYSPQLAAVSDIWIAGVNLSSSSKKILSALPYTRVIAYQFPTDFPQTPAFTNFTAASFARYECFGLLGLYEQVLYLDSDVLVQKELSPVFALLSNGIGLVADPTILTLGRNFSKQLDGLPLSAKGFNSGFMALNRKGAWYKQIEPIKTFLYKSTLDYAPYLAYPDQGIINLAVEKFKLAPTQLPQSYNCPASRPIKTLKKSMIIHATGPRKFWCYYYFHDFYTSYTQWVKEGGKAVSVRKDDSQLYRWLILHTNLNKYIFVQLCPDFVARPLKALRFCIKKWLHCRF